MLTVSQANLRLRSWWKDTGQCKVQDLQEGAARSTDLPGMAKVAFDKFGGEALSRDLGINMDREVDILRTKIMQDPKHTIVVPQGADLVNLDAIKKKVVAGWLAKTENGAQMLTAARSIIADIRAGN